MISNSLSTQSEIIVSEIFINDMGQTQASIADLCECSPRRINEIVNGKRRVSSNCAIVLERILETDAQKWERMELEFDLWGEREERY